MKTRRQKSIDAQLKTFPSANISVVLSKWTLLCVVIPIKIHSRKMVEDSEEITKILLTCVEVSAHLTLDVS